MNEIISRVKTGTQEFVAFLGEFFENLFCTFLGGFKNNSRNIVDYKATVFDLDTEDLIRISNTLLDNYNSISYSDQSSTTYAKDALISIYEAANILRIAFLERGKYDTMYGHKTVSIIMDKIECSVNDSSVLRHKQLVDFNLLNFKTLVNSIQKKTSFV